MSVRALFLALPLIGGLVVACGSDDPPTPPTTNDAGSDRTEGMGGAAGTVTTASGGAAGTSGASGAGGSATGGSSADASDSGAVGEGATPDASVIDGPQDRSIDGEAGQGPQDTGADVSIVPETSTPEASPDPIDAGVSEGSVPDGGSPDGALEASKDGALEASNDGTVEASVDGADGSSAPIADGSDGSPSLGTDASDAPSDAEAGSWAPNALPGLALWLSADVGVTNIGGGAAGWNDQSGHGNNAVQALATQRPAVVPNVLNGHAVLRFNGQTTTLSIPDSPSLRWSIGDFAIEVVARYTNQTNVGDGYGLIYSKQQTDYPYIGPSMWANHPGGNPATVLGCQLQIGVWAFSDASGLNDGTVRLYGTQRVGGTTLESRINGAVSTSTSVPAIDIDAAGNFVFIGAQQVAGGVVQALNGDIAEIVAIKGALPGADLAKVETYLKNKYGL